MSDERTYDLNSILPFKDWIKLAGVSKSTGRNLLAGKHGPKFVWMSPRMGIRMRDHIEWMNGLQKRRHTPAEKKAG
jgi:hypothetical protein